MACFPLVRPGYSVYYGHEAMLKLIDYMHAQHGNYQVEIDKISEQPGTDVNGQRVKVTVEARILPEPGHGRPAVVPVRSEFTLQNGLIVSKPAAPLSPPARNG